MDKAEIEKILEEFQSRSLVLDTSLCSEVATATSSLTALIIKWLESKREPLKYGRNQLITELIGEVR